MKVSFNQVDNLKPFKPRTYIPNVVRARTKLTEEQFEILEALYKKDCNPLLAIRRDLGKRLNLPQRAIQIWFQNRRAKSVKINEPVTTQRTQKLAKDHSNYSSKTPNLSSLLSSESDNEPKQRISEYWMTTMSCSKVIPY
ncbi:hypothetical protein K502DRAFT_325194 [Neoconidiobolus thromboides FSU 785]|nr:hypothetical protein K502DRAFT_325194 [Neoconidiobolus thromboides FSU 785]